MGDLRSIGISARGRGSTHFRFSMDAERVLEAQQEQHEQVREYCEDERNTEEDIQSCRESHEDGLMKAAEDLGSKKAAESARGMTKEVFEDVKDHIEDEHGNDAYEAFWRAQTSQVDMNVRCGLEGTRSIEELDGMEPQELGMSLANFDCIVGNSESV